MLGRYMSVIKVPAPYLCTHFCISVKMRFEVGEGKEGMIYAWRNGDIPTLSLSVDLDLDLDLVRFDSEFG
jgi:hypothetical protein